jgi:heat shock protein HslJ
MRRVSLFPRVCFFAFLASGCSGSGIPTSPTAEQLAGTWNVESIQVGGQPVQSRPPNTAYNLTFATDGRLSTRVDCNTCNGAFALSAETLTMGPALACTRAACPTMAFENAYVSLLSGEHTVTLASGALQLSSTRGVIRLAR